VENPARIPGPITDDQLRELRDAHEGGILPQNKSSVALATSLVIKPAAGKLYGVSVYNNNAAARFVQLHDATALPPNGAVPVMVATVATVANLGLYWGSVGRSFEQGIVIALSTTAATLTIAAADGFFDAQFV